MSMPLAEFSEKNSAQRRVGVIKRENAQKKKCQRTDILGIQYKDALNACALHRTDFRAFFPVYTQHPRLVRITFREESDVLRRVY